MVRQISWSAKIAKIRIKIPGHIQIVGHGGYTMIVGHGVFL